MFKAALPGEHPAMDRAVACPDLTVLAWWSALDAQMQLRSQ